MFAASSGRSARSEEQASAVTVRKESASAGGGFFTEKSQCSLVYIFKVPRKVKMIFKIKLQEQCKYPKKKNLKIKRHYILNNV